MLEMTIAPAAERSNAPATRAPRVGLALPRLLVLLLTACLVATLATGCKKKGADGADTIAPPKKSAQTTDAVDPTSLAPATEGNEDIVVGEDGIPRKRAKPQPPAGPVVLTPEQEAKIRAVALKRFGDEMAKTPPFDRLPLIKRLLNERYKIDFDQDFPYGFDPASVMTRTQVETSVSDKLNKLADQKFPPAQREALEQEALTKFPLREVGTQIKVSIGGGRFYEGIIRQIGPDFVMIGTYRVPFDDIVDPDPRSFSPEKTQMLREGHVRVGYTMHRKDFLNEEAAKLFPSVMQSNGFYRIEGKYMRIDEIIKDLVGPEVDKAERDAQAKNEEAVKARVHQEMEDEGQLRGENLPATVEGMDDAIARAAAVNADDGVRPKFVLSGTKLTVNGEDVTFPLQIKRLEAVLGAPERRVDILVNTCTVWDSQGISVFSNGSTGEVYDISIFLTPPASALKQLPTAVFPGRIVVDGMLLDRESEPATINLQITQYLFEPVEKKPIWKSKRDALYLVISQPGARIDSVRLTTRAP